MESCFLITEDESSSLLFFNELAKRYKDLFKGLMPKPGKDVKNKNARSNKKNEFIWDKAQTLADEYDVVFLVFDVDRFKDFPNEKSSYNDFLSRKKSNIIVCESKPCFEVFLMFVMKDSIFGNDDNFQQIKDEFRKLLSSKGVSDSSLKKYDYKSKNLYQKEIIPKFNDLFPEKSLFSIVLSLQKATNDGASNYSDIWKIFVYFKFTICFLHKLYVANNRQDNPKIKNAFSKQLRIYLDLHQAEVENYFAFQEEMYDSFLSKNFDDFTRELDDRMSEYEEEE